MKKQTLCSCFTWITFIEINFTVLFLLIRKLGRADLPVRWGMGNFKKWGDLVMRRMILKKGGGGGVDTPLWTMLIADM